jgi:GST-like protein
MDGACVSSVSPHRGKVTMITLYDFDASPNCLKTKILLKELDIPYHERRMTRAELRAGAYGEMFPTAQAPAIEDGDLRLAESGAIALYLAQKHGGLVPENPKARGLMYQALLVEASLLAPTVGGQGLFGELYKPEAERSLPRIAELRDKAVRVGKILGDLLGDRAYFAGEFSIADIQLYAAVSKSLAAGVFGEAPKNLVAWCERMTARPSVQAAREEYVHYRTEANAA